MHFSLFSAAAHSRLYTHGDLVFIQVCSKPTEMQCSTGLGKMQSAPLFCAALHNRLPAGLCHCIYTYGDLVFIPLFNKIAEMQCSTGLGKMHFSLFSAALQNKLTAGLCKCNYTCGDLLSIQVCSEPTEMQCSTGLGKMQSPLFSAALQNRLPAGLCHCIYTYGDLVFIHCAVSHSRNAVQHWSGQNAVTTVQCCSAKQAHSRLVQMHLHLWRSGLHTGVQ